ncbi:MAG TPA: hypothetical protein VFK35_11355 [Candidatus Limnocylindrales bacterium]|nr:hypothetical protein [Candidatus Limnocylindrales bacterium]
MNDAEQQFANRLAVDLERVLGAGIAVDDIEITAPEGECRVTATILIDGRMETLELVAPSVLDLYRPLLERAAELRLGAAFWRLVGPA